MNGPQHYAIAENLLNSVRPSNTLAETQTIAALAQAHATLAKVALDVHISGVDVEDVHGTDRETEWGKAVRPS